MAIPEWLFGPAGDLRPLPSPEMDVVNTVQRFGGIHNAINGSRTVDVLGHRSNYEFELKQLTPDEYYWLEALYTETIPGPFKLIDPLRKNLLSREAALAKPSDATQRGLYTLGTSTLGWLQMQDSPVTWQRRGASWTNLQDNSFVRFDRGALVPPPPDGQMTFSVYLQAQSEISVAPSIDTFTEGVETDGVDGTAITLPVGEWYRLEFPFQAPTGTTGVSPVLWITSEPAAGEFIRIIAPQLEYGTSATDASIGGGSATVVIDTMDTTSPYFPYQNVSLKLLEV